MTWPVTASHPFHDVPAKKICSRTGGKFIVLHLSRGKTGCNTVPSLGIFKVILTVYIISDLHMEFGT
jgi:hypothetical protein